MKELERYVPALELLEDCERLCDTRSAGAVEVDQPLVLISQVQRSGGTLLSQLLDGHPQCHAHPHELQIGFPRPKDDWPELDLAAHPAEWWDRLRESWPERAFMDGFDKHEARDRIPHDPSLRQQFALLPSLQRRLFMEAVERRPPQSRRMVLDAYMTSFFNAWLDNVNLAGPDKRWVTAFAAGLAAEPRSRRAFFDDYPDGRLISILREPGSWWVSARAYRDRYAELEPAMELWNGSTEAMVAAKRERPGQVLLLGFDAMVRDLERTVAHLTAFLGIEDDPVLRVPTINLLPTRPNSSFDVEGEGVSSRPLERASQLDPAERDRIAALTAERYEEARSLLAG